MQALEEFRSILDLLPHNSAHVNRSLLLCRHRHAVARPGIQLDDLLLLEFILCGQNQPAEIGAVLEVIDDNSLHLCPHSGEDMRQEIVRERTLLVGAAQKHSDGRTDSLIHINHKNLLLVPKENRTACIGRNQSPNLNGNHGFFHTPTLQDLRPICEHVSDRPTQRRFSIRAKVRLDIFPGTPHDVGMIEAIEKLLAIQDKDQRLRTFHTELAAIPAEKAAKERLIAEAASRLEKARTRAKEIEVQKKSLEVEAASKRDQIARYKTQQMQTRKNEEFSALAHEIETVEKAVMQIEDREIELMEEAESLKPQIAAAEQTYAADKSKYETQIANLGEKESNLKTRIAELEGLRQTSAAELDEDLLDRYNRLFQTKNAAAVVALEHEVCTGCHMKVTTQTSVELRAEKSIISCPQCGRILFTPA